MYKHLKQGNNLLQEKINETKLQLEDTTRHIAKLEGLEESAQKVREKAEHAAEKEEKAENVQEKAEHAAEK